MRTELAIAERKRRSFSKAFKAQVVAECAAGAPTAAVAQSHGLNTNMVWKWVRKAQTTDALARQTAFIAVPAPAPVSVTQGGQHIRIQLRRGDLQIEMNWPVGQAAACAAWLRDLLR